MTVPGKQIQLLGGEVLGGYKGQPPPVMSVAERDDVFIGVTLCQSQSEESGTALPGINGCHSRGAEKRVRVLHHGY